MNALERFIQSKPMGFLRDTDIKELINLDRLCQVLVRCGGCRFTCAAQDLEHLERCIVAGGDYVRDVSFPVGSLERAASWKPDCVVTPLTMLPASFIQKSATNTLRPKHRTHFNEADCGGVFDGFGVVSDADPGL